MIFPWLAFDAAYADESEFRAVAPPERKASESFFDRLYGLRNQLAHGVRPGMDNPEQDWDKPFYPVVT